MNSESDPPSLRPADLLPGEEGVASFQSDGVAFSAWGAMGITVVGTAVIFATQSTWPGSFFIGVGFALALIATLEHRSNKGPYYVFWLSNMRVWWRRGEQAECLRLSDIEGARLHFAADDEAEITFMLTSGREVSLKAGALTSEARLLEKAGVRFVRKPYLA